MLVPTSMTKIVDIKLDTIRSALCIDNEFIPVISIPNMLPIVTDQNKVINLYEIGPAREISVTNKVSNFVNAIYGHHHIVYNLDKINFGKHYYSSNGYVYYFNSITLEYRILMLLCIKSSRINNINLNDLNDRDSCILISNTCISNDEDNLIFRNIKRGYLDIVNSEIDVLYTNRILDLTFKSSIIKPVYKDVVEMLSSTQEFNNEVFTNLKL